MNISDGLKRAVAEMGFTAPTSIQDEVIPVMQEGRDCVALAPTGTGKTCAFGIPLILKASPEVYAVQSIVMCPTRELAVQTETELRKLSKYTEGIRVLAIYGGQNIERQLYGLRKKPQILVCTPGRLLDHLNRHTVSLSEVCSVVLDEADEMLDMGFREDISEILSKVREGAQVTMFSATMSDDIRALSEGFQHDPVSVGSNYEVDKPDILQYVIRLKEANKMDALESVMMSNALKFVLVFCNTKRKVDAVNKELNARGYLAASLHGDLQQRQRDKVMKAYRNREINILVATDVAARGIDVKDIEAIFNYDVPNNDEYYVHRIGRTARASKTGTAYTFATSADYHRIRELSKFADSVIEEFHLEGITDVRVGGKKANKLPTVETVRTFINIGKKDNLNDISLMQYVSVSAGLSEGDIQSVTLMNTFSFLEVVPAKLDKVLTLSGNKLGKHKIAVEVAGAAKKTDDKQFIKADSHQKPFEKKSGDKKDFKKPYDKKSADKKSFDKPYDKKSADKKSFDKPYDKKPTDKKSFDKPYDKKPADKKSFDKPYDKKPADKKSFDKPYDKKSADKKSFDKPYDKKPTDKKSFDKPYDKKPADKKSFDKPYDKKPYKTHGKDVGNVVVKRKTK